MVNFFKTKHPSLILYFTSSVVTSLGLIFKFDTLIFLTKPIIIPAIAYYYFQKVQLKIDWMLLLALIISFVSDMFVLVDPNNNIVIALLNLFVYFIFTNFLVTDFLDSKLIKNKAYEFIIILLGFLFLEYLIIDLLNQNLGNTIYCLYIFYGVILSLLSALAVFLNLRKRNAKTFNALIMVICFLLTDVFYVLYHHHTKLEIFLIINLMAQFFSYYWMIGYITKKA